MKILLPFTAGYFANYVYAQNSDYQPHYLVGLLNYPNSHTPDVLKGHTSGTYIKKANKTENWVSDTNVPYSDVPNVGFSDIEFYYDAEGNIVLGEYFSLTDNGFGSSDNSGDYPLNIAHMRIQKPFAYGHGGAGIGDKAFDTYTLAENKGTALIHDPNNLIKWENDADIQVTYKTPDDTWDDYTSMRVLTGRDIDPEGLAVINQTCAVLGEELMASIMMINPSTGEILSSFVRTPDIDQEGNLIDTYLSTRSDKVHCKIDDLINNADDCRTVDSSVVQASNYLEHHKSGGYEGFAKLQDGTIAAFLEVVRDGEPGARVYKVQPGNCAIGNKPVFESFRGFYPFEIGATNIADVSAIPGSSNLVVVIERNGFPGLGHPVGHMFPGPVMPANKVCVVDLADLDENMTMKNKKCILNYHIISDPWDVDSNGIFRYAQTQVTNEALIVVDDYCVVAGTDTNYPWTNQLDLKDEEMAYAQEVSDARFMVVCFEEPIFSLNYKLMDNNEKEEISKSNKAAKAVKSAPKSESGKSVKSLGKKSKSAKKPKSSKK